MLRPFIVLILISGCKTVTKKETDSYKNSTVVKTTPKVVTKKKKTSYKKLEDQNYLWKTQSQINDAKKAIKEGGNDILIMVPKDYESFCPTWPRLRKAERVQALTGLLAAMSKRESNINRKVSYTEKFKDGSGRRVVSRGLLQLSIESSNGSRYRCGIKKSEDLHEEHINLRCGVRILNYWVSKDGVFSGKSGSKYLGGGRYWSVMRDKKKTGSVGSRGSSIDYIKKITSSLNVCSKFPTKSSSSKLTTKPKYGIHSKAWADYFVSKCVKRVGSQKFCRAMTSPNKNSKGTFSKVYGKNTPFILMPKEDKFETGIRLLEIAMGADKAGQGKVCRIANWYRPEPYNSRVGGAGRSQHISAGAIDIKFCSRNDRNRAIRHFLQVERKIKKLGIGTYSSPSSVTIHLDFKTRNYGPK